MIEPWPSRYDRTVSKAFRILCLLPAVKHDFSLLPVYNSWFAFTPGICPMSVKRELANLMSEVRWTLS